MQAIWRFFAKDRERVEEMSGAKVKTGPQPVISKDVLEMRRKADEMLAQARTVYDGAMEVSEKFEEMQARDVLAEALLATKEHRGKSK